MTIFEFAIYRAAREVMTRQELSDAQVLAEKADRGHEDAREALRAMVSEILRDSKRAKRNGRQGPGDPSESTFPQRRL